MPDTRKYVLGLDAGNTVIKAVLFDLEGHRVARYALDGHTAKPAPGHVERDQAELWRNARQVISGCIAKAGISSEDIAGVGCAGHGNGLYLLDTDGEPLLGIQSLDTRADALATQLRAQSGTELHHLCRQLPWPAQTPVLLAWVKKHRPEIYARMGTAMLCKDFVTFHLTGERTSEISDMSGSAMLKLPEAQYDETLFRLYGLDDIHDKLPRLLNPTDIAGHVTARAAQETGLAEGTPVVAGLFDSVATSLGSGVTKTGEALVIAGSWSVNQVCSATPADDPSIFLVSKFGENRFINMEASATSAANLEWYVREFVERGEHFDDPFGRCNRLLAEVDPALDDPFFHPFLYGSGEGASHRAGFYGIGGWHKEAHIIRALFEGVVFEHLRHIKVLDAAGLESRKTFFSGGGARSPYWSQMFADALGTLVTVAVEQETGVLGAAVAAAVGVGRFGNYEDAIAAMTRPGEVLRPNVDMKRHYDVRYQTYRELTEAMGGFWQKSAALG